MTLPRVQVPAYRIAETFHGDTMQTIAFRELGNANRWVDLVYLNRLRPPFITNDSDLGVPGVLLAGNPIKVLVPAPFVVSAQDPGDIFLRDAALNNQVLEATEEGDFSLVQVASTTPGSIGNAAEGTITESSFFNDNVVISNQVIDTGRDAETETERETRFAEFIASLSRGTNAAIRYIAGQSRIVSPEGWIEEYITRIGLDEVPGRTTVYLYSPLGAPSNELIANCRMVIDGYRDEDTGVITPGLASV